MRATVACVILAATGVVGTKLATTPPLGWSSWNAFHDDIREERLVQQAKALKDLGLLAAGYSQFNIDSGWEAHAMSEPGPARNSSGFLVSNITKFPSGMEGTISQILSLGFSGFGMYAPMTPPGPDGVNRTIGFEGKDAAYFVQIGANWVKVDALKMPKDPTWTHDEVQRWRTGINDAGGEGSFFFSNCHCGCMSNGDQRRGGFRKWCPELTDMWRTSQDVQPNFPAVLHNLDTLAGIGHQAGPGIGWNDPDILEIGVNYPEWDPSTPGLTFIEGRTQFALWCVTSSPLLLGFDATKVSADVVAVVGNKGAIDVNQLWAGFAGDRVWQDGNFEAWAKPQPHGVVAIVVVNRGETLGSDVTVPLKSTGFNRTTATIVDVWTSTTVAQSVHTLVVPVLDPHDSVFWILKSVDTFHNESDVDFLEH